MAGRKQFDYCRNIKNKFPDYFKYKIVLDVGSMDINGNNKFLFNECNYIGLDLGNGENVDIICPVHDYNPGFQFDTIISTEMLEHDQYYKKSLKKMFNLLKFGGLMIITAAAKNREEHGTHRTNRRSSPFTLDYYKNVTKKMITKSLNMQKFKDYSLEIIENDLFFWGIKK